MECAMSFRETPKILDQESVPHPPVPDGSSELFAVDAAGETQIDIFPLAFIIAYMVRGRYKSA
jgi:hypothetical protein